MSLRRALHPHSNLLRKTRCKYPPWMVTSSSSSSSFYSDFPTKKGKAAPLQERRMRDRVRIWAKGVRVGMDAGAIGVAGATGSQMLSDWRNVVLAYEPVWTFGT
ncbi:putative GTP-binding protein OBGM, mitochondrial [Iris pallida]|uniref:GTP-binding protein OBGM, mitochondrial n=1 Tax=Iris pallida TaxID=29817 RepID=A0AAX6IAT9_IRIPA|nr:putative GTP-binding protein OBGM, mitochondrial [Iris pallida]